MSGSVLHGWKEISQYLGKSVRSVQRWERELGLPVRRLDTGAGQTVYARVEELERWREQRGAAGVPEDDPEDAPSPSGPPAPVTPTSVAAMATVRPTQPPWRTIIAGGLLLAVGFVLGTLQSFQQAVSAKEPVKYAFVNSGLRAYSASDQLVWYHDFGHTVSNVLSSPPESVDIDGDGRAEVVAAVRFGPAGTRVSNRSDAVVALNSDGTVRWQVDLQLHLKFKGGEFEGPWQVHAFAVQREGRSRRTWVAFGHHTWWPGVVLEILPDGTNRVVYLQSGRVRALAEWKTSAGHFLALGGVNNEYRQPSLAIVPIDPDAVGKPFVYASPQSADSDFACLDCGDSTPLRYYLFSGSEFQEPMRSLSATVENVSVAGEDLKVSLDGSAGFTIATVGQNLDVRTLFRADNFENQHRMLEAQGLLTHPLEQCPEVGSDRPVRVFSSSGWATHRLPLFSDGVTRRR